MTTSSLTSRNMLQLLLRRQHAHVARGCVAVAAGQRRAASTSEASKENGSGGFFGSFFEKRDISPQTTAHSAQLSMTRHGEFETERRISNAFSPSSELERIKNVIDWHFLNQFPTELLAETT